MERVRRAEEDRVETHGIPTLDRCAASAVPEDR